MFSIMLALIAVFAWEAPAQVVDSFAVVDSICFPESDSIWPVGVDGYGDYLWFANCLKDSGYRVDLSGNILSSSPLPSPCKHASAFHVDPDYVYYGPTIDLISGAANWSAQISGTSNPLLSVHFTDGANGWMAGWGGVILHTTDGGSNWNPQISGTSFPLQRIYFTDTNTGWAVGFVGTILHTSDGGINWNPQTSGTASHLFGVFFDDANTGWAAGIGGTILETTDGGNNWNAQISGTFDPLFDVYFADANIGWAVGFNGMILHSTDGGNSWNPQSSGSSDHLSSIYFADASTGWVVGDNGTILYTTDGGNSWNPQTSGTSNHLTGVYYTDANTGWVVGYNGTILRTTDGGSNWSPQASGTSSSLTSLHFADVNTGWAAGYESTILHYAGGPEYVYGIIKFDWNWNILDTLEIPPIPRDTIFYGRSEDLGFDGTRWWIGERSGDVYSWAPPENALTLEFHHSVSDFGDHLNGLEAVGNWIYVAEMFTDTVYQYEREGNLIKKYAYPGGEGGIFLEGMGFDPHGNFWYSSFSSTRCLYELGRIEIAEKICNFFLTPNKLNVTRNAEHTFMIHLQPCERMDVSEGDSAEVYVDVDSSSTFDNDERYPAVVNSPGMEVKIYCPDLVDNDPKVAIYSVNNIRISDTSGDDIVLYLDTFTPEGKGPKRLSTVSPTQFSLSQNYPNPFNPSCEIRYSLPGDCQVKLVIYNVLGQKVKVLVNEYQNTGSKSVEWDGKDDSGQNITSGVYFYRIQAGEYQKTRKMVLMK